VDERPCQVLELVSDNSGHPASNLAMPFVTHFANIHGPTVGLFCNSLLDWSAFRHVPPLSLETLNHIVAIDTTRTVTSDARNWSHFDPMSLATIAGVSLETSDFAHRLRN
jgi:hypothetical protein